MRTNSWGECMDVGQAITGPEKYHRMRRIIICTLSLFMLEE
jgi:hypothetical protein